MCHARLLSPIHHMLSSSARSVDSIVLVGCCGDCAMGLKTWTSKNARCRSRPEALCDYIKTGSIFSVCSFALQLFLGQ